MVEYIGQRVCIIDITHCILPWNKLRPWPRTLWFKGTYSTNFINGFIYSDTAWTISVALWNFLRARLAKNPAYTSESADYVGFLRDFYGLRQLFEVVVFMGKEMILII